MQFDKKSAIRFIILLGIISLLGDVIYEGARSVNGPYLKILGANAAVVGFIVGLGELLGYGIRLISGFFSDKTKAYWLFTILGYAALISVPILSLTGVWQVAALFMIMERIGKAIRSPAKDTILSLATKQVGTGFGFALHEFFDQIGAVVGPLIFSALFYFIGSGSKSINDYQKGYSLYFYVFILLMVVVFVTFFLFKNPEKFETVKPKTEDDNKLSKTFWLYTVFTFLTTFGFVSFVLIGYHLKQNNIISDTAIPLFYAVAMAVDAIVALIIGKIYDKFKKKRNNEKAGLLLLFIIPILTAIIPVLVFSKSIILIFIAVLIWGIVMGTHETIMKAVIADITSIKKRGTAYGIFNTAYGIAIFIGSSMIGILYDNSLILLIILLISVELSTIPVLIKLNKELKVG
ncbi:MAG: MFS transporter [Ignavibacteria bacterium GWB2_35_12]|nr:MAG: MFS transporter [Ignavibacteria bacterium GWA2_35_8]OGU41206.1 MAG: MFS transporter [Ignavibacteria bacterium GWB2_35_12]OGU86787.1 MAG: MFS transporter [Ignavibacteria bacterium RIFOXYA2_FULL_35_10]OGV23129.1 MAG: MFS transporter [Ignavibacteria bacterium RIFOXYC2_FULL_35_21]